MIKPRDSIAIVFLTAMLACGGCIAPVYNVYIGGEHRHDGTKQPTPEPDSRVDEVRRILDVDSD